MYESSISPLALDFGARGKIHKCNSCCKECDIEHTCLLMLVNKYFLIHTERVL